MLKMEFNETHILLGCGAIVVMLVMSTKDTPRTTGNDDDYSDSSSYVITSILSIAGGFGFLAYIHYKWGQRQKQNNEEHPQNLYPPKEGWNNMVDQIETLQTNLKNLDKEMKAKFSDQKQDQKPTVQVISKIK